MTKIFTGNIELDSYGIYQELTKILKNEDIEKIKLSYKMSFESGACEENDLARTASNHNPKPTRILTLLFREAKIRETNELISGLLIFTKNPLTNKNYIDELDFNSSNNLKLAIALDELRHLHMKKDSSLNKNLVLKYSKLFELKLENRLFSLAFHAYNRCYKTYCS